MDGQGRSQASILARRARLLDERERVLVDRELLLNDREKMLDERRLPGDDPFWASRRDPDSRFRSIPREHFVTADRSLAELGGEQLAVAGALENLARQLYGSIAVPDVLARLVRYVTELIDRCDSACAVCWTRSFESMVASDERGRAIAQMTREVGEGPLLAIPPGGAAISASGARLHERWPLFASRLADFGVSAVQAQPLSLHRNGERLDFGALALFATTAFDDADVKLGTIAASHGAVALARAQIEASAARDAARLQRAISSRDLLGRAKGILIERHRLTDEAAFEMLRETSQALNMKVIDVAEHLVSTGELPTGVRARASR